MTLPKTFYPSEAWQKNVLIFYAETKPLLPKPVLERPVAVLCDAIDTVITAYAKFPSCVLNGLEYSTNPLYYPGEFDDKVYNGLKKEAELEKNPRILEVADALKALRNFFEKNLPALSQDYASEITQIDAPSEEAQTKKFAETMHLITKTHVGQIIKKVKQFIEENPD